jgi:hypothetical protein
MSVKAIVATVSKYRSKSITALPAVERDHERICASLVGCGIEVTAQLVNPGRNELFISFRRFCQRARPEDDIILYFSGHGHGYGGRNFMIPEDAAVDVIDEIDDVCVPIDLKGAMQESKAASVTIIVDACREGLALDKKKGFERWRFQKIRSRRTQISIIYGCAYGDVSRTISDEVGSLFTISFCEALDAREYVEGTVASLVDATQKRLDENAYRYEKQQQEITPVYTRAHGADARLIFPPGKLTPAKPPKPPKPLEPPEVTANRYLERGVLFVFAAFRNNIFFRALVVGPLLGSLTSLIALTPGTLFAGALFGVALSLSLSPKLRPSTGEALMVCGGSLIVWWPVFVIAFVLLAPSKNEIDTALAGYMSGPTVDEQRAAAGLSTATAWTAPIVGCLGAALESLLLAGIFPVLRSARFVFGATYLCTLSCLPGLIVGPFIACPVWQTVLILVAAFELSRTNASKDVRAVDFDGVTIDQARLSSKIVGGQSPAEDEGQEEIKRSD